MKAIIFDSGTLISLSMNGLLSELSELKKSFNGKFIITQEVKREVIDKPLTIKRFELEALRIKQMFDEGILERPSSLGINEKVLESETDKIQKITNETFSVKNSFVHLIDSGEASCMALSRILIDKKIKNVIAVDERTTRLLCEKPQNLKEIMERRLHTKINSKEENYKFFRGIKIIRSPELIYVAYKKGIIGLKDGKNVLDALLYALKFRGAAISDEEIREIKNIK
jgi:hypothetical protein